MCRAVARSASRGDNPSYDSEIVALGGRLVDGEEVLRTVREGETEKFAVHARSSAWSPAPKHAAESHRLFVEQMRDGALMLSPNGHIRYCNEAFARLVGRPRERITGEFIQNFLADLEDATRFAASATTSSGIEVGLRDGTGRILTVHLSSSPLVIDDEILRAVVVTDLSRQELRLRHEAVVQASTDAIYALSPELTIRTWNRGAERIFGYAPSEAVGKSERDLCPASEIDALETLVQQVRESGESASTDAIRRCRDGTKIRVIYSLTPIREIDGRVVGYAAVVHDITERKRAERELRDVMRRTSLALATGRMGTYELDFVTGQLAWSDEMYELYGQDKATFRPTMASVRALVHPDDIPVLDSIYRKSLEAGVFEGELRIRRPGGRTIWIESRGLVSFDADHRPLSLLGVAIDITHLKEAEANQKLLIAELNHRVRNTLATVQAIASQTLRRANTPGEFVASFSGRIQALARAHTLLTRTAWQGTDLESLVREQLVLGSSERISFVGPEVLLQPHTALQLALVLHELGTNASKFGALSTPAGSVSVRWDIQRVDGEPWLHMRWNETGGPPVAAPVAGGFGTLLIERMLQQGHGGHSEVRFDPAGVTCEIRLPLSGSPISATGSEPKAPSGEKE